MPSILNRVRKGTYLDSVALMRLSRDVAARPGVIACGLMMGTPANKRILADAGVLADAGEAAGPGDLVLAIAADDADVAADAMAAAEARLDAPKAAPAGTATFSPRTIRAAVAADPAATLAIVSVPGAFAAAEARKALERNLDVLLFSDNVAIADEVELKRLARDRGRLLLGPDCGTAILGGVAIAFANAVPRGDIGLIGASGTGLQEVSCLIANAGGGISHALGVGGRDLKAEVGGLTTLAVLDLFDADPATRHVVLISKPPAADVASRVLERVARSRKPFTICFIGGADVAMPPNARAARTLEDAARLALGHEPEARMAAHHLPAAKKLRGLFAGGTLCAEAQVLCLDAGLAVHANAAIPGATAGPDTASAILIDLGDDAYTRGRPHPMIEPTVRDRPLAEALAAADTGAIVVDLVLGYGAHADPASSLVSVVRAHGRDAPPVHVSVTGTSADPQSRARQVAALEAAGLHVAPSNAAAVRAALRELTSGPSRQNVADGSSWRSSPSD
jgi:succinyl-CoA synthetase alpha subunit